MPFCINLSIIKTIKNFNNYEFSKHKMYLHEKIHTIIDFVNASKSRT